MQILLNLSIAITIGLILGGVFGLLKMIFRKKSYTEKQVTKNIKMISKISPIVVYMTMLILFIGFVWTVYFLILGIVDKTQTEYANNVSELLVGVLTVFSIIIAFFEFIQRKKQPQENKEI